MAPEDSGAISSRACPRLRRLDTPRTRPEVRDLVVVLEVPDASRTSSIKSCRGDDETVP